MLDLFGEEHEIPEITNKNLWSKYQKFKSTNNYHKTADKEICCKNCAYRIFGYYHDKSYNKCELMGVSHSEATDIRISYVCRKFKEKAK